MAETETAIAMDDRALFEAAMAPDPAPEAPAADPAPAQDGQPRDEAGRFAPKAEVTGDPAKEPVKADAPAATPAPQPEAKDDPASQVPSWRLREVSEARQAAERRAEEAGRQAYAVQQQLATLQRQFEQLQKPAQEPIDFFSNPDGAIEQRISPMQAQFEQLRAQVQLGNSKAIAIATHGAKSVIEMEDAVGKAMAANHPGIPLLRAQMQASDDPVSVAMQWHRQETLVKETGGDINAYKQRLLDEAMKDPAFQAKVMEAARTGATATAATTSPKIQLPPSISRAVGSGASNATGLDDGDMSDAALFKYATSPGRR